jgi:uncharacterized small protein (DUF1192 family)
VPAVLEVVYLFILSLFVAAGNREAFLGDESTENDIYELNERIKVLQNELADLAALFGVKLPSAIVALALVPGVLLILCYFALSALVFPKSLYLAFTAVCFFLNARGEARTVDRVIKIASGRMKEWTEKKTVVMSRLESGAGFVHALATAALCLQKLVHS